jgi:hypothetical protein
MESHKNFALHTFVFSRVGYWPEGKRPLGRPKCSWEDIIKMDLREIGWDGMDWIDLVQDQWKAVVNTAMNLQVP